MPNVTNLQNLINLRLVDNKEIDKDDIQLFAKINNDNYYPIRYVLDSQGKSHVENSTFLKNKKLFIGSKRQYLYHHYTLSSAGRKLYLGNEFCSAWNPDKYIVFVNNRLLSRASYNIMVPTDKNKLGKKVIFFFNNIAANIPIDIYYIESDDNFANLPINQDVHIHSKEVFANVDNQKPVKIPYPYSYYPRDDHTFMVFTEDGQHLNPMIDYKSSEDKEYITLMKNNAIKKRDINYIIFVFPYCSSGYEKEGEDKLNLAGKGSGIYFSYSKSIQNGDITSGIVNFTPAFTRYTLESNNYILFGNTTYIDPERFDVISNSQIKFKDPTDILHAGYTDYTMIVFAESKTLFTSQKKFKFVPYKVTASYDGQIEFTIPKSVKKDYFLLFRGSVLMDMENRYYWTNNDIVRFTNPNDGAKKGTDLVFLFYERTNNVNNATDLYFEKIEFETTVDGSFLLDPMQTESKIFDKDEIMLFLNGTYLPPERYNLINNKVTFTDKTDELLKDKAITGIYLQAEVNMDEKDPAHQYLDVIKNKDEIWFDTMVAKTYKYY